MKKLTSKLAVLFVLISSILVINAQAPDNRRMEGKRFKKMNLTEEQESQMKKFRLEHEEYSLDIKNQIEKNQLEIKKLLLNDNFDENKLLNLSNSTSELQSKIKDSRLKMWLDVYKILNPEQKKMWKQKFLSMNGDRKFAKKAFRKGTKKGFMKSRMNDGKRPGKRMMKGNQLEDSPRFE